MFIAGTAQRSLNLRQFVERIVIGRGDSSARRPEPARFPELFDADRRRDIGQVVFESRLANLVIPGSGPRVAAPRILRNPMQTHAPHALGVVGMVGGGHPAFPGRNGLGRVEREAGDVTDRADHPSVICRRQRMRGIFDHLQLVLRRQ